MPQPRLFLTSLAHFLTSEGDEATNLANEKHPAVTEPETSWIRVLPCCSGDVIWHQSLCSSDQGVGAALSSPPGQLSRKPASAVNHDVKHLISSL